MKKIKNILLGLGIMSSLALAASPVSVGAFDIFDSGACNNTDSALCNETGDLKDYIKNLVNALLYVLGAVSVIVIIMAGIFYATSAGDSNLVTKAKNTLLYAVVGLIVAILAYAIVNFVLSAFNI